MNPTNLREAPSSSAGTTPGLAAAARDGLELPVVARALEQEYEVLEELGRGGMAIVYRARERQLQREVAVKVLPPSLAFDAKLVERFEREARIAAWLEHPNIIPIFRGGRLGGISYFVMKLLRGGPLADRLVREGRLPPQEIRRVLVEVGTALGYAARAGVVHRDIKPENIVFDEHGHPVVTDFGIAKAAGGPSLTMTGRSIGTPEYMSPEQLRGQPLDGRSDIYSVGIVAYRGLTGTLPFVGPDAYAIGYQHITAPLPVPKLRPPEERSLFAIIERMTAKAPADRFPDAEALVAALQREWTVAVGCAARAVGAGSPAS